VAGTARQPPELERDCAKARTYRRLPSAATRTGAPGSRCSATKQAGSRPCRPDQAANKPSDSARGGLLRPSPGPAGLELGRPKAVEALQAEVEGPWGKTACWPVQAEWPGSRPGGRELTSQPKRHQHDGEQLQLQRPGPLLYNQGELRRASSRTTPSD